MKVKDYKVRPLTFDPELVKAVTKRRKADESVAVIAKALKVGAGKAAMAELIATTERKTIDDPAALARAIVKDRKAGDSWGKLAAVYGITEGTARVAFEAATGEASASIDHRTRAKPLEEARRGRQTAEEN